MPTRQQRADRELVRRRDRLVRRRRSVMVQIKAFLLTYGIEVPVSLAAPWRRPFVTWLKKLRLEDPLLQASLSGLLRTWEESTRHLQEHTLLLRDLAGTGRHEPLVTLR